jgi:hypothetical protein
MLNDAVSTKPIMASMRGKSITGKSLPALDRSPFLPQPVISGTTSAKRGGGMVKAAEIDLIQPEDGRKLPVVRLPGEANLAIGSSPEPSIVHDPAAEDPVANASGAIGRVEKMRSAISSSVLEFEQVRPESMSVVIRPDPETAVHLQMRVVNGEIRVAAHLELGDFSGVNLNWSELQQAVTGQNVYLADLSDGSNPLSGLPEIVSPIPSEAPVTRRWQQSQSSLMPKNRRPRALVSVRQNRESKSMQTIPTNSSSSTVPDNTLDRVPIKTVNQDDFLKVVAAQLAALNPVIELPQSQAIQTDVSNLRGSEGQLTQ